MLLAETVPLVVLVQPRGATALLSPWLRGEELPGSVQHEAAAAQSFSGAARTCNALPCARGLRWKAGVLAFGSFFLIDQT